MDDQDPADDVDEARRTPSAALPMSLSHECQVHHKSSKASEPRRRHSHDVASAGLSVEPSPPPPQAMHDNPLQTAIRQMHDAMPARYVASLMEALSGVDELTVGTGSARAMGGSCPAARVHSRAATLRLTSSALCSDLFVGGS